MMIFCLTRMISGEPPKFGFECKKNKNMAESHDLINKLPPECLMHIFSFLESSRDHCASAAVCRNWLKLLVELIILKVRSITYDYSETIPLCRRLEGRSANDITLTNLGVGTYPLHHLTSLYLGDVLFVGITDDGLKIIAQLSPMLASLTLQSCYSVGNVGLKSVAEFCKQLEKLELINSFIDDEGIMPIAENCLHLSALSLEHCPRISNESLMAFANKSLHLKSITLRDCVLIEDSGIFFLISSQPELMRIKLISMNVGNEVLKAIQEHGRALKVFYLEKVPYAGENLYQWIEASGNLEAVIPRPYASFTIRSLARLEILEMESYFSLRDDFLLALSQMTKFLQKFKLKKCRGFTSGGILAAVANWSHHLEVISLNNCIIVGKQEVTQEQAFRNFPSFRSLKLIKCEGVDDCFLSSLGPVCKQAKHITLNEIDSITDRGLQDLVRYNTDHLLQFLHLDGCIGISDVGLCSVLRTSGRNIQFLTVDDCTSITDQSLMTMAENCGKLKTLFASGCRVSDNGVFSVIFNCGKTIETMSFSQCTRTTSKTVSYIETMGNRLVLRLPSD
ncbi:EIN3-binding F-box protein 1-like isoform X1 [Asparagus officinalis]|uniref:EIN3-binding F-box protein 1-like isoform X1 n=2 Tax=Asparagus officinalis TaxID=4686 RepID=UPI00098E76B1|nr:EIN3-binding F-box protein 1-like isoform X1 [Asparagus officinalis]XP_020240863.1 EIN3-binding F-box protein 1-like isoform X1 [Asparagus officinalis]XP_020240864.1 EIN3-binding F-box protein 1-like isoform X1 [Asparagus officinalis]